MLDQFFKMNHIDHKLFEQKCTFLLDVTFFTVDDSWYIHIYKKKNTKINIKVNYCNNKVFFCNQLNKAKQGSIWC